MSRYSISENDIKYANEFKKNLYNIYYISQPMVAPPTKAKQKIKGPKNNKQRNQIKQD